VIEGMDVKKSSEKNNLLLKRKEITFFLDHDLQGTPQLFEVRKAIASMYGVSDDLVYVLNLKTLTGTNRTVGEAEIYDPPGTTRSLIPKHILLRNLQNRGSGNEKDAS
jgi:ribosomal protein S24E